MTQDKNEFARHKDELELLTLEILEVKSILRELSQQVLRIERRLKATLPPQKISKNDQQFDENRVRQIIGHLTDCAKEGKQIESELRRMTVKNQLAVLARELGMTNTKLPPKDELIRRISTRLRQRASITSGINRRI